MEIAHLLFDLDSTLYAPDSDMTKGFLERTITLVADFFHISREEAAERRLSNLPHYSTTLEWMRHEGLTDIERYLAYIHPESEADELDADENLRPLLTSIDMPKSILTNSPLEHAERVLKKLNVADEFESICDIRDCNFRGKPYETAYRAALKKCGGTTDGTLFFDDQFKYVDGYAALGGVAVLVGTHNGTPLGTGASPELSAVSAPPLHPGRVLRMADIYALPALLKQIADL